MIHIGDFDVGLNAIEIVAPKCEQPDS